MFDVTGNRQSMESSLPLVAFSGSLVLVGHTTGPLTFENPVLHRREITILASRNARADDWSQLLPLVASGELDAAAWVGRRTTLELVPEHLGEWGRAAGAVLKSIVDVGRAERDGHSAFACRARVTRSALRCPASRLWPQPSAA